MQQIIIFCIEYFMIFKRELYVFIILVKNYQDFFSKIKHTSYSMSR